MERVIVTLMERLEGILAGSPHGMSEHELLRRLAGDEETRGPFERAYDDDLSLFQAHFLLFHALYRLQERRLERGEGGVEIGVLRIRLLAPTGSGSALADPDPLQEYYLDLDNLAAMDGPSVRELLTGFWRRFLAAGERAEALRVLGLEDPVSDEEIQRRYRRLCMEHHPDRGGETGRLQEINRAMRLLRR